MSELLIQNCDVLSVAGGEIQFRTGQDVHVHDQHIANVVPHASLPPPPQAQIIDASHLLAIPGLMNVHTHAPMVLFRGLAEDVTMQAWFNDYIWPLEANLTPEDVYWGAMLSIAEMIQNGITFFADHYFFMDEVGRAVEESGLRADLAWAVFAHEGEEKLQQTCEFAQRWKGKAHGRITTRLGPHAPYTTGPDFLRLCARRAKELGLGIHTHVSETAEQVALSRREYGMTPIQMLAQTGILDYPTILAHCLYPAEEDFPILQQAHAGVAHAPKTYMKLGMGRARLAQLRTAGIPVGLATDGAVSSNTLDVLEQMRLMALTQKDGAADSTAMPLAEVLEIAFEGSARVAGQEGVLGRLEAGYLADITLLRQDGAHVFPRYDPAANLVYSSTAADVDTVICDGRVLMQGRHLLTIDLDEVKKQLVKRLEHLQQRNPGKRIAFYPA
jgi:5-methylthioadenosine/S-adenosylhomocysteine deaminase